MPGVSNVRSIGVAVGSRVSSIVQFALDDVTVCVVVAWSNSQRTVSPGVDRDVGRLERGPLPGSTESITTVAARAGAAPKTQTTRAATSASSADRNERMSNGSPPLDFPTSGLISNERK